MSQKESEWEGELKELLTDYKDAEISWGYGDPEDVTNAIGDIKDFIRQTIDTAVSNREKEIAEEVENLKEVCTECENREIHDTDRNKVLDEVLLIIKKDALSIIKHQ